MRKTVAHFVEDDRCASCAFRPGTEASQNAETLETARQCIRDGEPFWCHESVAVPDPKGTAFDKHGNRYSYLPHHRWRMCRGWAAAMNRTG